jgi:FixJ family two-component response regulator
MIEPTGRMVQPIAQDSLVIVIDDDAGIRGALTNLFSSVGLRVTAYASAAEMMAAALPDLPTCLVLDIRLPGMGGLELQSRLADSGITLPVVFMTGHGDIPMSVQAMKAGALDFLTKPFRDQDMIDAVAAAIAWDRQRRETQNDLAELRRRYQSLSARESDVMRLVTMGLLNKQVAGEMGLAEITVKVHRGNLMRKMDAGTLPALVRMAEVLGIHEQE